MKNKYERLFEGIKLDHNQTLLNRIYTQLYIIEGESEGVNEEHEVLQMEKTPRTQDTSICCNDIFQQLHQPGCEEKEKIKTVITKGIAGIRKNVSMQNKNNIKTVLTKGIAGVGKTVSVQKFILDWAEGKANQDVDFMFVLPFREINLIKNHNYSLHRLLLVFYPELNGLDPKIYEECKVVFIFDGLDESRIKLIFADRQKVCDVNESSSVGVLMSNLIRGELLPSALIWITSRPAAAYKIPSKYIIRVTEIQGFNDSQKEEYFRKRISNEHQASRIISHIRRSRSLHIMCHIPVFCWISATVLQNLLKQDDSAEIPQTLTEMYIHFLLTQINMKSQKYDERKPKKLLKSSRDVFVKLAKLAFKQLMKGNVMFYEEDLIESSIDITDASVYSGICTEIFKEESVIHQRKVYCFIHLSFQEFLAAFFVFFSHLVKNKESLKSILMEINGQSNWKVPWYDSSQDSLYELLKVAVDKSLQSENGHLDLFLRFLLGVSLESNHRLLQDLLTHTVNSSETIKRITQYIKDKLKTNEHLSGDRCINLFLCLLEMKDQTLYREIQEFVKSENHSVEKLSLSQCSTIAYMLQISEEVLDEFDLKKYNTTAEGRRRLVSAVVNCRKALLADCYLTDQCCESLSSSLQSSYSLRELDLSNNGLQDSGVKILSDGLKSSHCQLNILRLSGCMVTEEGCCFLASALSSNPSHLRELDLSYNHPGLSLVKLFSDPNYRLEKLKLNCCNLTGQCCESLSSCLQSSNSSLRELDLSNNDLQDSGVKLLSDGLKSSHCQLNILRLAFSNLTDQCCISLSSSLQSSNSLRELNLSNNNLQDSGVKLLSYGLKSSHCQLSILRLSGCMVTEEGCCFLASALSSNPSHLRELDLSYNHPGKSLVKLLSDLNYRLEKLNVDHGGKIWIKTGLQKYACDLTLDLTTANTYLALSERNRKVTHMANTQPYPDHAERFECYQVMCRESLTSRCYWEAKWSGREGVYISVTYKGVCRTGQSNETWFGLNKKSWSLNCIDDHFTVSHEAYESRCMFTSSHRSNKVGVYLDWSAGTLSFYSISDTHTLTHLHTFNTTFTEPLYAGFGLYREKCSVSLCEIKQLP
ncbi:NACHT, LRR and PYD domains-containing protein 3 isoform X10 [Carassius gibelio]|uniref:NACHT, LRR and PYD domains-containing protein 3 isoform X10 n=1 Tax=Carassius gibelio TaxID=101364 RepID=UPI002279C35F|nr:NACHT, LRR and PYD domains-containing protein 3 isoform X10 [Carassius gibelio]